MQTAEILRSFEPVVLETKPDMVVVVGDVNSTMACTLVAVKLGIPVAHVEAGLRSFDRSMPEEINRLVTDALSDLLFVSEPSGLENLRAEGVPDRKVHFVGNVMIDTLLRHRKSASKSDVRARLGVDSGRATHWSRCTGLPTWTISQSWPAFFALSMSWRVTCRSSSRSTRGRERTRSKPGSESELGRLVTTDPLGYLDFSI